MPKPKRLLLPVDYSARCLGAADCVRALATRMPVEVTVLHVTDEWAQRNADEETIGNLSDRLSGLVVRFQEVAGDPAQRIVEHARADRTDLIVMPTRAHGPVRRFLLGSVTAQVLHDVECPVWTGDLAERPFGTWPQIASVACGVDLGPQSTSVLRWAAGFADNFGARLTVMHANTQLMPAIGVVHDPEWRVSVARSLRVQLSELLADVGVKADIRLIPGTPAVALQQSLRDLGADVLVIGRSPKGLAGLLSSDAGGIIRRSPCAVVSVDPASRPFEGTRAGRPDRELLPVA